MNEKKKKIIESNKELEEIINNFVEKIDIEEDEKDNLKKIIKVNNNLNYLEITEKAENDANEIMNSLSNFFLDYELKSENFIKQKIKSDVIFLTDLIKQSKIAEYAIIKLIEFVEEGSAQPRHFEVLAALQRTKLDITKTLNSYLTFLEQNYKSFNDEYISKKALNNKNENDGLVLYGTKDLIKNLRSIIDNNKNISSNKTENKE